MRNATATRASGPRRHAPLGWMVSQPGGAPLSTTGRDMTDPAADLMRGARDALPHVRFDDEAQLVEPRIGSMRGVVGVVIDGAQWALPSKSRVAPGRGVLFVLGPDDDLHVLLTLRGRIRELLVPADLSDRIRAEAFGLTD